MITPDAAEVLANATIAQYVNSCDCETPEDIANVLMKLASMCGLGMSAVAGRDEAVQRLLGTAQWVQKTQQVMPWAKGFVQ
ncbi:hypothetical protein [Rhodoferax sp. GW822-FHT02A01]|uniref:hypothetical protein n=1 Tax=Rhodoferax sp. GW822-FHT02A01 TaxID=3141537 RepID=UPI00315CC08C